MFNILLILSFILSNFLFGVIVDDVDVVVVVDGSSTFVVFGLKFVSTFSFIVGILMNFLF